MHEMGIALQVIDIATASIPEDMNNARVERVNIKVGKLSAIVVDSLRFCFDIAKKDTALENAELAVEEVPVTARCNECRTEWTIESPVFTCAHCNSPDLDLLSGRELDITSIELANEDP